MPRSWKRKTDRGVPLDILKRASNDVKEQGKSIRSVAKVYGISHVTLYRFCKERKKLEEKGSSELPRVGYHSASKVFTAEQEKELADYLIMAADAYYGLSPREVRELAFQYAVKHGCKHPKSWDEASKAGADWFAGYMKRNPTLSIRSAEATSLARATSVDKTNVAMFFSKLGNVIRRDSLTANDIWNVDETGITTVQSPDRVMAKGGPKRVPCFVKERSKKGLGKKQGKPTGTNQQRYRPGLSKKTSGKKAQKTKNVEPQDTDSDAGWVKCVKCSVWALEAFTPGEPYTCHHCDSDDSV